ncbi:MAG: 23S rRNA (guanosine(2251)-2'-O)-methyltransferase RlmB [Rickettsiales bacterium]|nr:23S rRNA (guanosine(2251)-2'-O)-methyltransferase RlmB [Rickettsiales bacterium]
MVKVNSKSNNNFYIYGKHPVLFSLKNKKREFFKIYTSNIDELKKYIQDNKISIKQNIIEYKANNELNKLFIDNINHQGYVASVSKNKTFTIDDFVVNVKNQKQLPRIIILDQLTDPHNIGAIIRTAVAFNVEYIITTKYNSPKDYSVILKSSAGMSELINIIEVVNVNNTIEVLKKCGYFVIGMAGEARQDIKDIKDSNNLCLVIGSEGNGIRQLVKKNCDELYKITTNSEVESLNASVATAIAIYKLWG